MTDRAARGPRRVVRAQVLVAEPGAIYSPGQIEIDAAGRVLRIGPCARAPRRPRAIVPGLVNAHVHLQIPALPRREPRFLPWVGEVMRRQGTATAAQHRDRGLAGLRALFASGVTAVGEIDSTGHSPDLLRESSVAGRCYRELTGFHLDARGARALLDERRAVGSPACPGGWSPHAPYSVSAALLREALRRGRPVMMHVAEIAEEDRLLRSGSGPLRALLERLGRWPAGYRAPGVGSVEWLHRCGALGPRFTLVHAQHLVGTDVQRVAASGSPIVVCPGTIEYFGRAAPDVPGWLAAGIPVALGTDSRASNRGLDLRAELRRARRLWPTLEPTELLAMATTHGARALCRPSLGVLRRGGRADFAVIDLPDRGAGEDFLDRFTRGGLPVAETWLAGRRVYKRG